MGQSWIGVERGRWGCRPRIDVFHWGEDFLARVDFFLEEAFKFEEFFAGHFVFERGQPALMQSLNLELQEIFLLVGEFCEPFLPVEFDLWRLNRLSFSACGFSSGRDCLWWPKERGDAGIGFRLLCICESLVLSLALERHDGPPENK